MELEPGLRRWLGMNTQGHRWLLVAVSQPQKDATSDLLSWLHFFFLSLIVVSQSTVEVAVVGH